MQNFGEILKEHRVARGLTLKEIEYKTNINNGCLSRWERNEVLPSIQSCIQLANFYGITLDELLGFDESYAQVPTTTATPMGAPALPSDEQNLLNVYRNLSPEMRDTLWSLLNTWSTEVNVTTKNHKK